MKRCFVLLVVACLITPVFAQDNPASSEGVAHALPKDWRISYGVGGDVVLTLRRGNFLLANDQVWQIRSPKKLWAMPVHPAKGPLGQPAAISEDGNWVVYQEKESGAVSLFGRKGPKRILAEEQPLICAAFLPEGRVMIAVQTELGKIERAEIRVLETATLKVLNKFELPLGLYYSLQVDPLGRSLAMVSSQDDGDPVTAITLYDLATGKPTYQQKIERKGLGRASSARLAFAEDGTRLACATLLSGSGQPSQFLLVCMSLDSKDKPLEAKLPISGSALDLPLQSVGAGIWLLNYSDQIGTFDEAKKSYSAISSSNRAYSGERVLVINSKQAIVQQTDMSTFTNKLVVRDIAQLGKP